MTYFTWHFDDMDKIHFTISGNMVAQITDVDGRLACKVYSTILDAPHLISSVDDYRNLHIAKAWCEERLLTAIAPAQKEEIALALFSGVIERVWKPSGGLMPNANFVLGNVGLEVTVPLLGTAYVTESAEGRWVWIIDAPKHRESGQAKSITEAKTLAVVALLRAYLITTIHTDANTELINRALKQ
jgi:hypothetical protein